MKEVTYCPLCKKIHEPEYEHTWTEPRITTSPARKMRKWPKRKPIKRQKASKRPKKPPTRTKLIKEADRVASLHVRQSRADKEGMVKCYTCDHVAHWKKMQNGHWVVRQYKYVRWHEDNMRPQCYSCNFLFNGRPHIFRAKLVEEIGEQRVSEVETKAILLFKEKDDFIIERIKHFTELTKQLEP